MIQRLEVEILWHTPEPELTIATAMRRCRDQRKASEIKEELRSHPEKVTHLVELALASGHFSVLEHVIYSVDVTGVSKVLTHQLVRHRIAPYFQLSGRVVSEDEIIVPSLDYLSPPLKANIANRIKDP